MNIKLVIFDLDGTLLDTLGSLSAACNAALKAKDLPLHSNSDYCNMIGNGITKLVELSLPSHMRTESNIEEQKQLFLHLYTQNISLNTTIYNGIEHLLYELENMGIMLAVASNKFHSGTTQLVSDFFGNRKFVAVYGNRDGVAFKPDPAIVEDIIAIAKVNKDEVVYIGDSEVDIQTARNAGIKNIGVSWGLRGTEELISAKADIIVDNVSQILEYIRK